MDANANGTLRSVADQSVLINKVKLFVSILSGSRRLSGRHNAERESEIHLDGMMCVELCGGKKNSGQ